MTKPVLYLTNNIEDAIRKLRPQTRSYHLATNYGVYKSGDEYYIIRAGDRKDRDTPVLRGTEFSRFEVIGYAHPDLIEAAELRIRP